MDLVVIVKSIYVLPSKNRALHKCDVILFTQEIIAWVIVLHENIKVSYLVIDRLLNIPLNMNGQVSQP